MIISANTERELAKIQHQFLMKTVTLGTEDNFTNLVIGIYKKSIANITLTDERLNAFSLRSRQGCLLSKILFNTVTESSLHLFISQTAASSSTLSLRQAAFNSDKINIQTINDSSLTSNIQSVFQYDSAHEKFNSIVKVESGKLVINEKSIFIFQEPDTTNIKME